MKYNPADRLGMMLDFLKMGNQKANIQLLKEYVYDLIQLMTQKTAGQSGNKTDISFDDIETIKNCIVIEAMALVLSGKLEDIMTIEDMRKRVLDNFDRAIKEDYKLRSQAEVHYTATFERISMALELGIIDYETWLKLVERLNEKY